MLLGTEKNLLDASEEFEESAEMVPLIFSYVAVDI